MDQNQTLKRQIMESYLRQQRGCNGHQSGPQSVAQSAASSTVHGTELVQVAAPQENITLEEFREYVRKWLELDNSIKKAQEAIKERKRVRDKLAVIISGFMCKYNIEDLNTKEGRIRCKITTVKAPVNQRIIKEKITDFFSNDEEKKTEILTKLYDERPQVEKVSLRRLKIT